LSFFFFFFSSFFYPSNVRSSIFFQILY